MLLFRSGIVQYCPLLCVVLCGSLSCVLTWLPCAYATLVGAAAGGGGAAAAVTLIFAGCIFNAIVVFVRRAWTRELSYEDHDMHFHVAIFQTLLGVRWPSFLCQCLYTCYNVSVVYLVKPLTQTIGCAIVVCV